MEGIGVVRQEVRQVVVVKNRAAAAIAGSGLQENVAPGNIISEIRVDQKQKHVETLQMKLEYLLKISESAESNCPLTR